MNWLEKLEYYQSGIKIGLLTADDLTDFIFNVIENENSLPYVYYDIAIIPSRDFNTINSIINDSFSAARYKRRESVCNELISLIGQKYFNSELNLKKTAEILNRLSLIYAPYSSMSIFIDYCELAEIEALYTWDQVREMIEKFLHDNT